MELLFKPFSQIESGLARRYEGSGLGLAMVKVLADLHGGAIAVESSPGEGSRFTVWLPVRPPEEEPQFASQRLPPDLGVELTGGAGTVLVVEDDFKSAELIRLQLEAEGFHVLHAASAEAALVLAVQQPLALITLDVMLPNMDGWEFLSRLKQVPSLSNIPVVIISIVAERNKGFALGAAAVIEKPIVRQELLESLTGLGLFPSQIRPIKVLVVDDDPKAVELVSLRIQGMASTVLRAYGGREAIEIARRELPDLMVLDLMMADLNGFEVVEALKDDPRTAGIPIVVVTAKRVGAVDRARINAKVTAIMEKVEFDRGRFMAEVRRAVARRPNRVPA